ncbi:MAG: DUF6894 family protein [Xanthobacteraceae bacterium]
MARYYFHIRSGADFVRDEQGVDLAGPDHARAEALQSARELCAQAIKRGRDLCADEFVIVDDQGSQPILVSLAEALPARLRNQAS